MQPIHSVAFCPVSRHRSVLVQGESSCTHVISSAGTLNLPLAWPHAWHPLLTGSGGPQAVQHATFQRFRGVATAAICLSVFRQQHLRGRFKHRTIRALAETIPVGDQLHGSGVVYEADGSHAGLDPDSLFTAGSLAELEAVDSALWPLLLRAVGAEAPGSDSLGPALGHAAKGLAAWSNALNAGRVWEEAEGANWPLNKNLRTQWTELLKELDMPRFVRRYPGLLNPLLASLLETVEQVSTQNQGQADQTARESSEGLQESADADSVAANGASSEEAAVTQFMDKLRDEWGTQAHALKEAENSFGSGALGEAIKESSSDLGFGSGSESVWHETSAWEKVSEIRSLLSRHPELRKLIRELGRRSALKGPLRRLPEELSKESAPLGIVRSNLAPAESSGVRLSGEWDTMLPSEAQLLASHRQALQSLHHARRIERSLLSYDRNAWLEEEACTTARMEPRPLGKAGPLIVCLDTSGSMSGDRETLGKALVFESLRQAHRQKRRCYLYAFSGSSDLQEMDLSLSATGLQQLMDFLKFSFSGGTSLDAALEASVRRVTSEGDWRNADMLIVTDGELPPPDAQIVNGLHTARTESGTRVVGITLNSKAGSVMEELCTQLYTTGDPYSSSRRGKKEVWPQLRRVDTRRQKTSVSMQTRHTPSRRASVSRAAALWSGIQHANGQNLGIAKWGSRHSGFRGRFRGRSWRSRVPLYASKPTEADSRRQVDFAKFSDALILVIEQADREARRLGLREIYTEVLLLGVLASPATKLLRKAVFPDAEAIQRAQACVEDRILEDRQVSQGLTPKRKGGPPLPFTPMAERSLLAAEDQREKLGQTVTEPEHLLLGLFQDPRGTACEMLGELRSDIKKVRMNVLDVLPGAVSRVLLEAEQHLDEIVQGMEDEARVIARQENSTDTQLTARLIHAYDMLTEGLVERSVEAKLLLLGALGGEHVFLLGPPGTAKSLLARRLSLVCQGRFFERLLTRFTVPEEVFGPLSLKALENDELRRKTEGYLPDADVTFLDEVFKANSSILNALLTLLNERVFDNGGIRSDVPLWCAVAASNELPESDELDALYDRFLLRRAVPRISDSATPDFLKAALSMGISESSVAKNAETAGTSEKLGTLLTAEDSLTARREAIASVRFPDHLLKLITSLRTYMRDEAEPPVLISDRRLAKAVCLLRVAAYAVGLSEVSELHMLLLKHMFWDREPQQAVAVRDWIFENICGGSDGGADDYIRPPEFLLKGVKLRLSKRPLSSNIIATCTRDLRELKGALMEQLRTRISALHRLEALLSTESASKDRNLHLFWLEQEDVDEARQQYLPTANSAKQRVQTVLQEVLEFLGALTLPAAQRDACLDSLIKSEGKDNPKVTEISEFSNLLKAARRNPLDILSGP